MARGRGGGGRKEESEMAVRRAKARKRIREHSLATQEDTTNEGRWTRGRGTEDEGWAIDYHRDGNRSTSRVNGT